MCRPFLYLEVLSRDRRDRERGDDIRTTQGLDARPPSLVWICSTARGGRSPGYHARLARQWHLG
ncbi:protein of unknown function [Shewanella benthica]|uniref:Uncharacterized protein n=1 Tax=Shewanella benthica TaxID=43661 RepID=A0A330M5V4_9GAMM|nr:protein of unknown function [Shewanella benthica]